MIEVHLADEVSCPDTLCRPGGYEITRRAARLCGWERGARVLDLGCGSGASLRFLEQELGLQMQGLELDASLCDGKQIFHGDAACLPWESGSQEGILMECSFSRMTAPGQVLAECRRVLQPGGKLAISDMFSRGEEITPMEITATGEADWPENRLALGRLEHLSTVEMRLTLAGFRILTGEDWTAALRELWGQAILDGRKNMVCRSLGYGWGTVKRARCGYYLWICEPDG